MLGYESSCINFVDLNIYSENKTLNKTFDEFRARFLNCGLAVSTTDALKRIYSDLDAVVVGSDQVFRLRYNGGEDSPYFAGWVRGDVLLVSYGASFGIDRFEGDEKARRKVGRLLARFDAHSVRESSGVGIMKDAFGLDAVQVLDPTLLLDPEDYQPIMDSEPCVHPDRYVGVMFLDEEHWDEFRASALYRRLVAEGYDIVDVCKDGQGAFRSVPQWLTYVKHASRMVTDSFHGTVFSIIFRRPFVTRATADRGNARIESLCRTLDIPLSRFHPRFDGHDDTQFDTPIDFDPIRRRIEEERVVSMDYLRRSLAMTPKHKEMVPVRRDRAVLPLLSVEERERDKRLLLFGCIPTVGKAKDGGAYSLCGVTVPSCLNPVFRRLIGR